MYIFSYKVPTILVIFISVLVCILLARIAFAILFFIAKMIYHNSKKTAEFFKKDVKKYIKEEDELLRKLEEIPKAHSATRADKLASRQSSNESYELIESDQQQKEKQELSEVKIVDVVKPIGFWTSMILGQKLTYLIQSAQIINKRANKGFWVSMVEAQEQAAGRQHGRTR